MKNKRGMLLAEETLKIIIALIGIGFLVYFLVALYFATQDDKSLEQAKKTLERVDDIIKKLAEGKSELQDISPKGWYLFGFTEKLPNVCAGGSCVCICDRLWKETSIFTSWEDRQRNECSEEGACLVVNDLKKFTEIKITDKLTKIEIKKENSEILITKK
jgi:hypothetical protein